jgi:hypothetical protein
MDYEFEMVMDLIDMVNTTPDDAELGAKLREFIEKHKPDII